MKKLFIFPLILLTFFIFGHNVKSQGSYEAGSLLALEGAKDAAVYYIAVDGKKYVFPDLKTYRTWYSDFSKVLKVTVEDLDAYPDGGAMSYRAGIKLVTHPNTGRVYAVEPGGVLRWIASEEIAKALYGENWHDLVQDIIPGYFASSYTKGEDMGTILPTGTVAKERSGNFYYYIDKGQKRKFLDSSTLSKNNFFTYQAVEVGDLSAYPSASDINDAENSLISFQPLVDDIFDEEPGDISGGQDEKKSPIKDQKILFLSHSVGRNLYEEGKVADWFDNYNTDNNTQLQFERRDYPDEPYQWSSLPHDFWNLWVNGLCSASESGSECLSSLVNKYDVIIFSSNYEASDVLPNIGGGSNSAVNSTRKSIENYQLQYRALRDAFVQYPDTIFITFTLPPRHRLQKSSSDTTPAANAARASEFSTWLSSQWPVEGNSYDNVFVFDIRSHLTDEDNYLKFDYESAHTWPESHPNTLANQTVAPIFSQFIIESILEYNQ